MASLHSNDSGPGAIAEACKFYKHALFGYLSAYKRLKNWPKPPESAQNKSTTKMILTKIVLAAVADYIKADLYRKYLFRRHLSYYERFGRSAPWRVLQTNLKLGHLLMQIGKLDEALQHVQHGVEAAKAIFGACHDECVAVLGVMVELREVRLEYEECYRVAITRAKAFMGWREELGRFTGSDGKGHGHGTL